MSLERPVFIIGNPRSGTNLLRTLLTFHKDIIVPLECGFITWLQPPFEQYTFESEEDLMPFVEVVTASTKFETWGIDSISLKQFLKALLPLTYPQACGVVYLVYAEHYGQKVGKWGDKNNYYLHQVDELYNLFPKAQFVHIVRDGRDVASSYEQLEAVSNRQMYAPDLPSDIEQIASEHVKNVATIAKGFAPVPSNQKYFIKYEDLVTQPVKSLTALCNFLALPFDSEMLNYHRHKNSPFLEPRECALWKKKNNLPIDASSIGKQKRILTADETALFTSMAQ